MPEKDSRKDKLSNPNRQAKLSMNEPCKHWLVKNTQGEPAISDILNKPMKPQPVKDVFERLEQPRGKLKSVNQTIKPKDVVNNSNFVKREDAAENLESKIEKLYCKVSDLENNLVSVQKDVTKLDTALKTHENEPPLSHKVAGDTCSQNTNAIQSLIEQFIVFFSHDIHWKSFAGGVLSLASILFLIYLKFSHT